MLKRIPRLILILVVLSLAACGSRRDSSTEGEEPISSTFADPFAFGWDDRAAFSSGLIASEQEVLSQLPGASVYHLDLMLDDDLMGLDGRQEVRYTNQEAEPLSVIYFRLYPNLFGGAAAIHSLKVDGQEVEPSYELLDSAMGVPLPNELEPGESVVIEIEFAVSLPEEGGGNYNIFAYEDAILALAHFYPIIAVYDDEGWNLEIPSREGDVLYSDSSFYIVRVSAPSDLTIVASGVEIGSLVEASRQQVTYAGGPMRDFYLAVSERFVVVSAEVGETTINSYAPPEFVGAEERVLEYALRAKERFDDRFGVYPFTEFDIVSTPTLALGIEYPGVVAIALRMYDPETSEYPEAYLESTVAHEVAHQWFYSVVGNDQLDEPWVDESLAQYVTMLYFKDQYGAAGEIGFRDSLESRWAGVEYQEIPIGMPVAFYIGWEYSAIVYGRGALFFDALADVMGQEALEAFLQDYYGAFKWGIATTESLRALAEDHCDCDLSALFLEWVYAP